MFRLYPMKTFLIFSFLLLFFQFSQAQSYLYPKREFRGAWIATVVNIDWPDGKNFQPEVQKQKFREILDFYEKLNFNAVIVQIRTTGDAFFASQYEPWSRYLTGTEGKAPEPLYDPLQFMIEATHAKGMEFHAWFNPYRGKKLEDTATTPPHHAIKRHPEWFIRYGKTLYFNPGLPEVQQFVTNVVMEVVHKYEVDAIHFDDYFYPYKIKDEALNDSLAYRQYGGAFAKVDDWRRNNVDLLIKKISDSIRAVKPQVEFGISPFGVWRNMAKDSIYGSDSQAGQTCYDDLYADVLKWCKEGWIDYVVPQLYWSIGFKPASYSKLIEWWSKNHFKSKLYIGQGPYKINNNADSSWLDKNEIAKQVNLNRIFKQVSGSVFFSAKSLIQNPLGSADLLGTTFFKYPALPPLRPGGMKNEVATPLFTVAKKVKKKIQLDWTLPEADLPSARYFLVYGAEGTTKPDTENPQCILAKIPIVPAQKNYSLLLDKPHKKKQMTYCITAVNKANAESQAGKLIKFEKNKVLIEK